jgi:hypothetical protein
MNEHVVVTTTLLSTQTYLGASIMHQCHGLLEEERVEASMSM